MIERLLRLLSRLAAAVGALALVMMMLHITLSIVLRLVFNIALPQTVETVSYIYMLAAVFMPLALVELAGEHVSVTLLSDQMRGIPRRVMQMTAMIAALAFYVLMAWNTGHTAWDKTLVGEYAMGAFALPTWPGRWMLPIGSGLLALVLGLRIVQLLRGGDLAELEAGHSMTTGE